MLRPSTPLKRWLAEIMSTGTRIVILQNTNIKLVNKEQMGKQEPRLDAALRGPDAEAAACSGL